MDPFRLPALLLRRRQALVIYILQKIEMVIYVVYTYYTIKWVRARAPASTPGRLRAREHARKWDIHTHKIMGDIQIYILHNKMGSRTSVYTSRALCGAETEARRGFGFPHAI